MKKEHIFLVFVLIVTFLAFHLLYRVLSPFLGSILWAVFLAIVCHPPYGRLQKILGRSGFLSAITMTILVVLVVVLPFSLLVLSLADEAADGYHAVDDMIKSGRLQAALKEMRDVPSFAWILEKLEHSLDLSRFDPVSFLLKNLQQISTVLYAQSSNILKGVSTFLIGFVFTLLSLYYLFKDGGRLLEALKEALPVPPRERDLVLSRFSEMVNATIYGGLLIALIQGVLGGLTFWVLRLPSPVLWGTAMALFSFIPLGGTAFIWVPASVILLVTGSVVKGIVLLGFGIFLIGMVDNFIRPFLVGSRTKIHPLILLFTVLGGIQAFGMIGVIVGPLIATLCLTLIEIYAQGTRPKKESDA